MSKRMMMMFTGAALAIAVAIAVAVGAVLAQGAPHAPGAGPGMKAPAGEAPSPDPMMAGDESGEDWLAFGDEFDMEMLDEDAPPAPPAGPGMGARRAPGMHRMGMGHGLGSGMGMALHMGGHGAWQGLDLTRAQRDKMADVHERQMRLEIRTRADLQLARLDLMKAMRAAAPNRAAIDLQIDRIARMRADQQKARVGTLLEARTLLTDEQREKLRGQHLQGGPMRVRIRERVREDSQ